MLKKEPVGPPPTTAIWASLRSINDSSTTIHLLFDF
jgi:hypothetical protein